MLLSLSQLCYADCIRQAGSTEAKKRSGMFPREARQPTISRSHTPETRAWIADMEWLRGADVPRMPNDMPQAMMNSQLRVCSHESHFRSTSFRPWSRCSRPGQQDERRANEPSARAFSLLRGVHALSCVASASSVMRVPARLLDLREPLLKHLFRHY